MAASTQLDVQKKTAHTLEQERSDVLKKCEDWFDAQSDLDPQRLVLIDETSLATKMVRLRGRALRGERCRTGVPHGHWKTTTFTGALREQLGVDIAELMEQAKCADTTDTDPQDLPDERARQETLKAKLDEACAWLEV